MNKTFWSGIALVLLGIIAAIWLGGWVFFIGGIVQFFQAIQADPVNAWGILFGIIRFNLCWVAFWVALFPIAGTGIGLIKSS